jgi:hypothetical protein
MPLLEVKKKEIKKNNPAESGVFRPTDVIKKSGQLSKDWLSGKPSEKEDVPSDEQSKK